MKRIKSIQLFFQEGNSDKVYIIELIETGEDAFVVNFKYGRRGSVLKEGTKTVFPLSLKEAENIVHELELEKRKKGYRGEGEDSGFIAEINPIKAADPDAKKHKVIIKLLKAAVTEEAHETWPVSRIIWRAAELNLKEAAPFIVKLADRKDYLQLYTCIWGLCRTGDSDCVPFLKEILLSAYPSHLINLARATLLHLGDEGSKHEQLLLLKSGLPESLKQAMDVEFKILEAYLKDHFIKLCSNRNDFLIPFYFVSNEKQALRALFIQWIALVPIKPGYFKSIRQLFKISEMLKDTELYGVLSRSIEKAPYNFKSGHQFIDGKWLATSEELKKENSRLAFSQKTKDYFSRRIIRTLRKFGKDKSPEYTRFATDLLLPYQDTEDLTSPEKTEKSTYEFHPLNNNYTFNVTTTWYDSYSAYRSFYYILYANSERYKLIKSKSRWQCVKPFVPSAEFKPIREEAFELLWNHSPNEIIRLLSLSKCSRVADFALLVFNNNSSFKANVVEENLIHFLYSPFFKIRELGFVLVKEMHPKPGMEMLTALLLSELEEAITFAQACINASPLLYANDIDLLLNILLIGNVKQHLWLKSFLQSNKPERRTLLELLQKLIQTFHSGKVKLNESFIQSLTDLLHPLFEETILQLDAQVIFGLLAHPDALVQGFAAKLLVLRKLDPSQVPDKLIFSLLESNNTIARTAAVDLLSHLSLTAIAEKQSLVLSLCLSSLQDVRQAAQKLIDKLLEFDPQVGNRIVQLFIPVLTVKEKYDGLHHDILQLISAKLHHYLTLVPVKQTLSLCTSRYLASQELGYMLLEKNKLSGVLTIKELIQIANAHLLQTRQFVMACFSDRFQHVLAEKQIAVSLADSIFEDVRVFAFEFFRTRFQEKDWEPEMFILLCDSVKPDVQAYGREMISSWFEKDNGFEYLLKLSQHPDQRMQLFASGFLDQYAKNNFEMLMKLSDYFVTLLSQLNKGRTAKTRAIHLLSQEALINEENAGLIAVIFNRMSATVAIQDKALYIKALLEIHKKFPSLNNVLQVQEIPVYKPKPNAHAV